MLGASAEMVWEVGGLGSEFERFGYRGEVGGDRDEREFGDSVGNTERRRRRGRRSSGSSGHVKGRG